MLIQNYLSEIEGNPEIKARNELFQPRDRVGTIATLVSGPGQGGGRLFNGSGWGGEDGNGPSPFTETVAARLFQTERLTWLEKQAKRNAMPIDFIFSFC